MTAAHNDTHRVQPSTTTTTARTITSTTEPDPRKGSVRYRPVGSAVP